MNQALKARLERLTEETGLTARQIRRLTFSAYVAGKAQEREHNVDSDAVRLEAANAVRGFETAAKVFGFDTQWPGLYPNLVKDGKWHELPLDLLYPNSD